MRKLLVGLVAALGIAAAPAMAAGSAFLLRIGDITGEGAKPDKKSGQQLVPATSWFWEEYVVASGGAPVAAKLLRQGYYDTGSVRVSGKFTGCEVGKHFADAELKTPGARYLFTDVTITRCKDTSITFNYGSIRATPGSQAY